MKKLQSNEVAAAAAAVTKSIARLGATATGNSAKSGMVKKTKSDPTSAQFSKGDTLFVPNNYDSVFKQTLGTADLFGVVCPAKTNDGAITSKVLYFGALDRSVAVYGDDLQPTGDIEYASTAEAHDVYDAAHDCVNDDEVFNAIKGKTLIVNSVKQVKTARYRDGQIVGTRTRNVPVFTFDK